MMQYPKETHQAVERKVVKPAPKPRKELKRRGRKRERDDVYFVKGNQKIEEIRE